MRIAIVPSVTASSRWVGIAALRGEGVADSVIA